MNQQNSIDSIRYEVITQEDPESGDLMIPIPQPILDALGWEEGADLEIEVATDGSLVLKKAGTTDL